jgi:SAM-dependent methyltransferase
MVVGRTEGTPSFAVTDTCRISELSGQHGTIDSRTIALFTGGTALLDLGCGHGYWLDVVGSRYERAIGIDVSTERFSQRESDPTCWTFVQRDLADRLPADSDSIDAVHANQLIEHVPNPLALAIEVHRVLRPGGLFVAATPNIRYVKHIGRLVLRGKGPATSALPTRWTPELWDGGHLHYFTPDDVEWIAGRAGFSAFQTSALVALNGSALRVLLDRFSAAWPVKQFLSGNTLLVARK